MSNESYINASYISAASKFIREARDLTVHDLTKEEEQSIENEPNWMLSAQVIVRRRRTVLLNNALNMLSNVE